jgi:hypothetical protein
MPFFLLHKLKIHRAALSCYGLQRAIVCLFGLFVVQPEEISIYFQNHDRQLFYFVRRAARRGGRISLAGASKIIPCKSYEPFLTATIPRQTISNARILSAGAVCLLPSLRCDRRASSLCDPDGETGPGGDAPASDCGFAQSQSGKDGKMKPTTTKVKRLKCCIYGTLMEPGYLGNRAGPYKKGSCCDQCDREKVIPARIAQVMAGAK